MDTEASQKLQGELAPRERLLWSGKPVQGLLLRPSDGFLIPFSLFWCGFAIFWEYMAITSDGPAFFPYFGIPFVAIGLYLVVGRFFYDNKQRRHCYYAVTDKRILILSEFPVRRLTALMLENLPSVSIHTRKDGSGTIELGPLPGGGQWLANSAWPGAGRVSPPALALIHNARAVHDVILRAIDKLKGD